MRRIQFQDLRLARDQLPANLGAFEEQEPAPCHVSLGSAQQAPASFSGELHEHEVAAVPKICRPLHPAQGALTPRLGLEAHEDGQARWPWRVITGREWTDQVGVYADGNGGTLTAGTTYDFDTNSGDMLLSLKSVTDLVRFRCCFPLWEH